MSINVYHGRRSYEINAELEPAKAPSERYPICNVLPLTAPKLDGSFHAFATSTREGVAEGVRRLAGVLQRCIDAGMLQNRDLFSDLERQEKDSAHKYAIETQLLQARNRSEAAWREKNFERFVEMLAPFEQHLTPVELKKLEYSRKQV